MKKKVLIIIEGGLVQNIIADSDEVEIAVVDYDGDGPFVTVGLADEVYENISDCIDLEEAGKAEKFVYRRLKEENFF